MKRERCCKREEKKAVESIDLIAPEFAGVPGYMISLRPNRSPELAEREAFAPYEGVWQSERAIRTNCVAC